MGGMVRGPMELAVVEFMGDVPGTRLAPELKRLVEADVVRIVDLSFVTKNTDGTVSTFELADREGDPEFEALEEILYAVDGLVSDEDLDDIAEDVSEGATAMVVLIEHAWAGRLQEIMNDCGGEVVFTERISSADTADATSRRRE
jgi:uncharacterized membrane protein